MRCWLIACLFISLPATADELFAYNLRVYNPHLNSVEASAASARMLLAFDLQNACIDLRAQDSSTVRILLRRNADNIFLMNARDFLCGATPGNCGVEVNRESKQAYYLTLEVNGALTSLQKAGIFPLFSNSCTTGNNITSIYGSATSIRAHQLIAQSGVAISDVVTLSLRDANLNAFWQFGRPNPGWDGGVGDLQSRALEQLHSIPAVYQ